jgi:hypothetical protein
VPKCKVVENIFIFNFAFYALSLKHFSEEIWALSGLCCATPRTFCKIFVQLNQCVKFSGKKIW